MNLGDVLGQSPRNRVPEGAIPTSGEVPGPANDAAAVCGAASVQSVSPPPARVGEAPEHPPAFARPGWPSGSGMASFGKQYRQDQG
jgi:phospholipase C